MKSNGSWMNPSRAFSVEKSGLFTSLVLPGIRDRCRANSHREHRCLRKALSFSSCSAITLSLHRKRESRHVILVAVLPRIRLKHARSCEAGRDSVSGLSNLEPQKDGSPVGIDSGNAAPTPTGLLSLSAIISKYMIKSDEGTTALLLVPETPCAGRT